VKKALIKPTGIFFRLLIAVLLASCGGKEKKQVPAQGPNKAQMAMKVDVFVAHPRPISETAEVPGTILANEASEIHSEVSGRVVILNVSEGRFVGKGALLAKIYDGDLQAQLQKLKVQLKIAEQTENRQSQLLKIQGISQQDYDLSLLQVSNLKADIDIIQTAIRKSEIRAPFSGKLGLKNISNGAYVSPATVITTISQVNQLKLDFTVPEKYTDKIKSGQKVEFTIEGNKKLYTAKVIATEAMVSENTRSLQVRAIVQDKNADLIPGTFAKVTLSFDPDPNALMVPTEAVLPQARGKKIIKYENGIAKFHDITTGVRDSAQVQVVSGIKAGDTVIITGLLSLRPEAKVEVNKITNQ